MSIEKVKEYLDGLGLKDRVLEFATSSATVELAAQAVGCEPAHIAKTLGFMPKDTEAPGCILVVAAGDAKVDNKLFKQEFDFKAKMLPADQAEERIGHRVGGVCPFVVKPEAQVYLDESLRRFEVVYPAAGSANSAVRLNLAELERAARPIRWVNVCKY